MGVYLCLKFILNFTTNYHELTHDLPWTHSKPYPKLTLNLPRTYLDLTPNHSPNLPWSYPGLTLSWLQTIPQTYPEPTQYLPWADSKSYPKLTLNIPRTCLEITPDHTPNLPWTYPRLTLNSLQTIPQTYPEPTQNLLWTNSIVDLKLPLNLSQSCSKWKFSPLSLIALLPITPFQIFIITKMSKVPIHLVPKSFTELTLNETAIIPNYSAQFFLYKSCIYLICPGVEQSMANPVSWGPPVIVLIMLPPSGQSINLNHILMAPPATPQVYLWVRQSSG